MAVKRIMRYLRGTRDMGLLYDGNVETTTCVGYSDVNWAGDLDDRKSTSGYVFQISNAAISWRSKKQSCVALSTAEAEYMALASATQEAIWLQQLLTDLKSKPNGPMLIFEDNQAAICMRRMHSTMDVQNTLTLNIILSENILLKLPSNWNIVALKK